MHLRPVLTISCNGPWQLTADNDPATYPATVPGCVHTDLLAAGVIPDPWYRDNEKELAWVWQQDWTYTRSIDILADLLDRDQVELRCDGLDTLAELWINDQPLGRADNMFRTWIFDAKALLRPGTNELRVRFRSPRPVMQTRHAQRPLPRWNTYHEDFAGSAYLRKMACAFGWDWGLMAPTAGIWRSMTLIGHDTAIDDLRITEHHTDAAVSLSITAAITGPGPTVRVTASLDGQPVATADTPVRAGTATATLDIPDPRLWWPNQLGDQPLYHLHIELLDRAGRTLDTATRRIGLRTLELIQEPDPHGTSFRFAVNGKPFFAKGANWIPCDIFPSRIPDATYRHLLQSSADAGMNMLRVWGGGIYEDERFYDLCDELGLLVWQDFMFACSTYPTFDPAFMDNVRAEATDQVRRLRHRACLALWCGNNELEQGLVADRWTDNAMSWDDYRPLFDHLLPDIVAQLDGVTAYWPCSPHTPEGDGRDRVDFNDPTIGDAHAWSVWFGGEPFEAQRRWTYRFMSEFGFQSLPEPRTVATFTEPADRRLNSWIMDFHQRSGPGNPTIFTHLLSWFGPPKDFGSTLWLSQITQALCIEYAADHARRITGRMDGLLYWQLNDLWPGATWSSIDVCGRWKALQYFARRFFAPVRVSLLESHADGSVAVHLSNQRPEPGTFTVHWRVVHTDGRTCLEGSRTVTVASQTCQAVDTIACQPLREAGGTTALPLNIPLFPDRPTDGDRDLLIFATVQEPHHPVTAELSRTMASFARPKHLTLRRPRITAHIAPAPDQSGFDLTLDTDVPAPWTRLAVEGLDAPLSDNFLHLIPGLPATVRVPAHAAPTADALHHRLTWHPLLDLWSDGPPPPAAAH